MLAKKRMDPFARLGSIYRGLRASMLLRESVTNGLEALGFVPSRQLWTPFYRTKLLLQFLPRSAYALS